MSERINATQFEGNPNGVIAWLSERGVPCELNEDPYSPRRDSITIYAPNDQLRLKRGEWLAIASDGSCGILAHEPPPADE